MKAVDTVSLQSRTTSKEKHGKVLHAITLILQIQRYHLVGHGLVPDKWITFRILQQLRMNQNETRPFPIGASVPCVPGERPADVAQKRLRTTFDYLSQKDPWKRYVQGTI